MSIASDGAWAADTMPNELDGFNVWEALTTGKESPRTELELVHNYYDSSATWGSAIRVGRVEADLWPSKSAMVSAVWKCIACSADEKSTAEVRQLPYPLHSSNNDISEVGLSNGNPAAEAGVQCSGSGRNEKWRLPLSYCKPTQTKRQTC